MCFMRFVPLVLVLSLFLVSCSHDAKKSHSIDDPATYTCRRADLRPLDSLGTSLVCQTTSGKTNVFAFDCKEKSFDFKFSNVIDYTFVCHQFLQSTVAYSQNDSNGSVYSCRETFRGALSSTVPTTVVLECQRTFRSKTEAFLYSGFGYVITTLVVVGGIGILLAWGSSVE